MKEEVRSLDHRKRRTWGSEALYRKHEGMISREVVREAIREERRARRRGVEATIRRYEFVAPDIAWSVDFVAVPPAGRALRVQDERARFGFGLDVRNSWADGEPTRAVGTLFSAYRVPYALKHDLGPEFTSGGFQALLRGAKVISLPSPAHYPPANGKHERTNGPIGQWLLPLKTRIPVASAEEVVREAELALEDNNEERRKEVLGWRTPHEVYTTSPRCPVDRNRLYEAWLERTEEMMQKVSNEWTRMSTWVQMEARRLAALSILGDWNLVIVSEEGGEVPKV